ncbi:acyltransferase [Duganella sp. BJB475]|uniref:LpxL/LpxP family acyltransferase n=1 Tax=Duganella sp. BJB475 TaxID=2233914 RepID=UPI000E348DA4|nr:acyltransferase [Duganella sp. BJB475]RFP14545.1 acyltransferase [Duganella sp. BJB475]
MIARRLHWASINEITFVAGMRLMFWICRVFGRWPFRVMLYPVLCWYVLSKPRPRRASQAYLRRVASYTSTAAPGVLRHFAAFGESILDKMLLWSGLFKLDTVDVHGGDLIVDAAAAGRGGLVICAHLGNLELCRVLSRRRHDIKLTVLVHTKHAQAFNDMLARLNPASQLNLLQVTEMSPATAMLLSERVVRGEFVVIAGDRIPVSHNPRVALADFMGAPAPFPVGPYVLANLLQCPVFLLFSIRQGRRSALYFEAFRDAVRIPRQDRDAAFQQLAGDYARRLEHYCLRAPLQWFNFYDFWHLAQLERSDAPR